MAAVRREGAGASGGRGIAQEAQDDDPGDGRGPQRAQEASGGYRTPRSPGAQESQVIREGTTDPKDPRHLGEPCADIHVFWGGQSMFNSRFHPMCFRQPN